MSEIRVTKENISTILDILSKFPEVYSFTLKEHSQSGIGSCLDMEFDYKINDTACRISVVVSDQSNW